MRKFPFFVCLLLFAQLAIAQPAPEGVVVTISGKANLSWTAPTQNVDGTAYTDPAGFNVYVGRASRDYTLKLPISVLEPSSGTITIPITDENDLNWFMAMTAFDSAGVAPGPDVNCAGDSQDDANNPVEVDCYNESAYSNEVAKTATVTFSDSRDPDVVTDFEAELIFQCSTDNLSVTCDVTVQ